MSSSSTTARRVTDVKRAVVALVALGALSACGDDAPEAADTSALLQKSDLPPVASTSDYDARNGTNTVCAELNGFESNLATTKPKTIGTQFSLENGDRVISTLLGLYVAEGDVAYATDRVDAAIDECLADPADADSFERLDGLTDGAVGFRSVLETSDGPVTTERAYAVADDDHVVVVTVEHTGGGEASTSVADLLPVALDRAD